MPDGGLFVRPSGRARRTEPALAALPERGVLEAKGADADLEELARSEQIQKYLAHYGLVLATNLREFRLLRPGEDGGARTLERYVLARSAEELWNAPLSEWKKHNALLGDFLARAMLYRAPLVQPKDVAWVLASYAREARARAEDHPLGSFESLRLALQESLGIRFEGEKGGHFFRSTLVQTLFYGMFSAWVLWRHTEEGRRAGARFRWREAAWHLRVPVLQKLFGEVANPGALNAWQLQEILDRAGEALDRVQPEFFAIFRAEDAVAYFYEPFLEAFDPRLREELGVWYTPREIVSYMVERVDTLLRMELGRPDGLASKDVLVLDPCCGTGAYLTAVLERIHRILKEKAGDDAALVPYALREAALKRVFGFEILPAPFVIAHMRLAALLEDAGAALGERDRAGVFLTNALTGWVPEEHPQSVIFEEFRKEREAAERVKQTEPLLVILGNPPYNGYAGIAQIEEERDLKEAYRGQVTGVPKPQGQGLNDLYIRFFRVAERRVTREPGGEGIICFISNNNWLDGLSHPSMRSHYLHAFRRVFIDNLNGDKFRTGKTTPEGRPDPSVFSTERNREGIQPGTAVAALVRTRVPGAGSIAFRDLWGTGKLAQLEEEARGGTAPEYTELKPSAGLGLPFLPRAVGAEYLTWPRLPELFPVSFPGVKTSRDALVVDIDRERLEARMRRYLDLKVSDAELALEIPCAMESGARFDPVRTRRVLLEKGLTAEGVAKRQSNFRPWQVLRYCYRPFDLRWVYWEPETKLLDEKREEYVGAVTFSSPAIVSAQSNRRMYDGPYVTRELASLHVNERGCNTFPLEVLDNLGGLLSDGRFRCRTSAAAWEYLKKIAAPAEDLFFHALAIMHTPTYRADNAGALLGDWPRIPLPRDAAALGRSAALGRRLAELLDPESTLELAGAWSFLGKLVLPVPLNLSEHLKITAGWGYRGQGETVMPGRGLAPRRGWTDTERERLHKLGAEFGLPLAEVLALLGEHAVDVHLNGAAHWAGVPEKVWGYTLGGYQVLKKWLSYREAALLGRPLHPEEAVYFAQVVRRIAGILLLGTELDASYAGVKSVATV